MKRHKSLRWVARIPWFALLLTTVLLRTSGVAAQNQSQQVYYFPKPLKPAPYVAPMKPLVRLAELKAKHHGETNWTESVVEDYYNRVEVIAAAPGSVLSPYLHADSPEYWYVEEGTIRFTIDDPPGKTQTFVAEKGSLVFAPERMLHSLEVLGNEPAIRVQVTLREASAIFAEKPANPAAGMEYIPMRLSTEANPYDVPNPGGKPDRLFFNLDQMIQEHGTQRDWEDLVIMRNRAHANIICGYAADAKHTPGDRGHFHDFPEIWVIMRGQLKFSIEGESPFVASQGDIIYALSTRWHRAEPVGEGPACRLAMTPFPAGNHLFDPLPQK